MSDEKTLTNRLSLINAFEQKYGLIPARVEQNFLLTAEPHEIVQRFSGNPGPGILPQEIGEMVGTSGEGWVQAIGTVFQGDSLVETMVPVYKAAFKQIRDRNPSPAELEAVMSVGYLETRFGTAKFRGGVGPGMNNHGAVQAGKPPCNPDTSFLSEDSSPQGTGGNVAYAICFRRYATPVDGAADLIKHLGKLPLRLLNGNRDSILAFALGMYGNRYYESFNPPEKVRKEKAVEIASISRLAKKEIKATEAIGRAVDPVHAGRVFMYATGLNGAANAIAKATGRKRATKFEIGSGIRVDAKTISGAGIGAIAGFMVGGPIGGLIGAGLGGFGGSKL